MRHDDRTTPLERAEQARLQAERVRALADTLRALLAGRMTRAEVLTSLRELSPPGSRAGNPFRSGSAAAVFDSLHSLDEQWEGRELVRDVDLRAYLRWICEGESFLADEEPLICLARDIDDLSSQAGTEAIRWWFSGLGWHVSTQFSTPARGRPFVAHTTFKHPAIIDIHKQQRDDWHDALIDLFEALAIDDADALHIHPTIDLARLPVWTLWRQDDNGNRFEMARTRSYAKACAQERTFTARGHKQNYWVEAAT